MQYSLKAGKKFTSEEKENNSKCEFYHSRNTKPEVLLKAQHLSAGCRDLCEHLTVPGLHQDLTVLRTHSSHNPTAYTLLPWGLTAVPKQSD